MGYAGLACKKFALQARIRDPRVLDAVLAHRSSQLPLSRGHQLRIAVECFCVNVLRKGRKDFGYCHWRARRLHCQGQWPTPTRFCWARLFQKHCQRRSFLGRSLTLNGRDTSRTLPQPGQLRQDRIFSNSKTLKENLPHQYTISSHVLQAVQALAQRGDPGINLCRVPGEMKP